MSTKRKVAVLVGSLRKGSFNRMTAGVLAAVAPAEMQLEILEIRQLPLYNQDDDDAPPAQYVTFREAIRLPSEIQPDRSRSRDPAPHGQAERRMAGPYRTRQRDLAGCYAADAADMFADKMPSALR